MSSPPIEIALIYLVVLIGIAIGGFFSSSRPYNILAESWRQALATTRYKPWLFFFAWLIFAAQEMMPHATFLVSWSSGFVQVAALVLFQAIATYLLAHIAFRLHRGLIHDEWVPLIPRGRYARRMALYVVLCWAVIGLLKHPPLPLPPVPHERTFQAVVLFCYGLGFVATAALAVVGPAASLDERRPIHTSIRTALREPIAILVIIISISILISLVVEGLNFALGLYPDLPMLRLAAAPLIWGFMAFILFMSEFALVIFLTRVWEDRYEEDTRRALHNFNWT